MTEKRFEAINNLACMHMIKKEHQEAKKLLKKASKICKEEKNKIKQTNNKTRTDLERSLSIIYQNLSLVYFCLSNLKKSDHFSSLVTRFNETNKIWLVSESGSKLNEIKLIVGPKRSW